MNRVDTNRVTRIVRAATSEELREIVHDRPNELATARAIVRAGGQVTDEEAALNAAVDAEIVTRGL